MITPAVSYAVRTLSDAIGAPHAVRVLVDAGMELTRLLALASGPMLLLSILLALPTTTSLVRRGERLEALRIALSFLAV